MSRESNEPGILLPDWLRDDHTPQEDVNETALAPDDHRTLDGQGWNEPPPPPDSPLDPDAILTDTHLPDWLKSSSDSVDAGTGPTSTDQDASLPDLQEKEERHWEQPQPPEGMPQSRAEIHLDTPLEVDRSDAVPVEPASGQLNKPEHFAQEAPSQGEVLSAGPPSSIFEPEEPEVEIPLVWLLTLAVFVIAVLIAAILLVTG